MDLVVESKVVVELKSVDKLLPIHQAQLMTYLRLSGLRVGLLINFNVKVASRRIGEKSFVSSRASRLRVDLPSCEAAFQAKSAMS